MKSTEWGWVPGHFRASSIHATFPHIQLSVMCWKGKTGCRSEAGSNHVITCDGCIRGMPGTRIKPWWRLGFAFIFKGGRITANRKVRDPGQTVQCEGMASKVEDLSN